MAPGMTTKDIPLAGVIGDPVGHSLSPKLHGHWLKRYGLRGHYVPMRVAQSDLVQVLRTLPLMGFKGVNVTIPHKEHVLSLADSVTDRAALIGAANTLTFTSQGGSRPTIPMAAASSPASGSRSRDGRLPRGLRSSWEAVARRRESSGRCSTMARRWCMWRTGPVPAPTG
jgi:hypothetical protein